MRLASRAIAGPVASLLLFGALWTPGIDGQATNPVVAATVEGDSLVVGGVFALDLWVELPQPATDVRFPAVLPLPEDIEQREAVSVESNDGGRAWRATYTLSAWSTDSLTIPEVTANVVPEGGEEFPVTIVPPTVVVSSVLPADEAELELREARPYLRVRGFPWWLVLIAGALAALAYWLWRRRRPELVYAPSGPGQIALRDLEHLRREWGEGRLTVGQFYDRYEQTLRRYARITHRWSPSRSLIGLGSGGDLVGALRRSAFIRFAHLRGRDGGPESAIGAGEAFIRSELPAEEESDESPSMGPRADDAPVAAPAEADE